MISKEQTGFGFVFWKKKEKMEEISFGKIYRPEEENLGDQDAWRVGEEEDPARKRCRLLKLAFGSMDNMMSEFWSDVNERVAKIEAEEREERQKIERRQACYQCGFAGHMAMECPERLKCWLCGEIGHKKRDCKKVDCWKCGQLGHLGRNCGLKRRRR